jgi:hypothetical protein
MSFESITSFFGKFTVGKKVLIFLTPILTVLLPLQTALAILALMVTLDFITGVRKSLHKNEIPFNIFTSKFWVAFKSEGMRRTWTKSTEYGVGILMLAGIECAFFGAPIITLLEKAFTLTELGVLLAVSIEFYSIFENLYEVNPKSPFLSWFRKIGVLVRKYVINKIEGVFKSEKD